MVIVSSNKSLGLTILILKWDYSEKKNQNALGVFKFPSFWCVNIIRENSLKNISWGFWDLRLQVVSNYLRC